MRIAFAALAAALGSLLAFHFWGWTGLVIAFAVLLVLAFPSVLRVLFDIALSAVILAGGVAFVALSAGVHHRWLTLTSIAMAILSWCVWTTHGTQAGLYAFGVAGLVFIAGTAVTWRRALSVDPMPAVRLG